jgi:hypothetical protein
MKKNMSMQHGKGVHFLGIREVFFVVELPKENPSPPQPFPLKGEGVFGLWTDIIRLVCSLYPQPYNFYKKGF